MNFFAPLFHVSLTRTKKRRKNQKEREASVLHGTESVTLFISFCNTLRGKGEEEKEKKKEERKKKTWKKFFPS